MKAAVIREFGDVDVLKYEEIATPKPKPGHVLIKVLAAGVNRFDHYIREGSVVPELTFPHILGADAAGEVAELGEGVSGFEIGDRVVPVGNYPQNEEDYDVTPIAAAPSVGVLGLHFPGTYAQYMEVPARWVLKFSARCRHVGSLRGLQRQKKPTRVGQDQFSTSSLQSPLTPPYPRYTHPDPKAGRRPYMNGLNH